MMRAARPIPPAVLAPLFLTLILGCGTDAPRTIPAPAELRAALVTPRQVDAALLARLRREEFNTVVLPLAEGAAPAQCQTAAVAILGAGLSLGYWIEVGRSPTLAQAHPEWVAVRSRTDPAARAMPWVPIDTPAAWRAQLDRVIDLLRGHIAADVVLLNDLQGAPEICGCRNPLCPTRPARDATFVDSAAARFVAEVDHFLPRSRVVPVWSPPCTQACCPAACQDTALRAWQAVTAQASTAGVLWLDATPLAPAAVTTLRTGADPSRGQSLRLFAVLQGVDTGDTDIQRRLAGARAAGAQGHVLVLTPLVQSVESPPGISR